MEKERILRNLLLDFENDLYNEGRGVDSMMIGKLNNLLCHYHCLDMSELKNRLEIAERTKQMVKQYFPDLGK